MLRIQAAKRAFTSASPKSRTTFHRSYHAPRPSPPSATLASHRNSTVIVAVTSATVAVILTQMFQSPDLRQSLGLWQEAAADTAMASSTDQTSEGGEKYASKSEIRDAIKLLRGKLRDDQITTDEDERLGHGHSPNTYHGTPDLVHANPGC